MLILKTFAVIVVLAVAGLLLVASTQPDVIAVQRSAVIAAPPDKLYALIDDMNAFNRWNPYNRKDPQMKGRYEGPAAGPGAAFHFEGNKDVGQGSLTITGHEAGRSVAMELHMIKPFEGRNAIRFTLAPQGQGAQAGTQVTWAMTAPANFISKIMSVFINMDRMIGKDFEAGLANLKALAEQA